MIRLRGKWLYVLLPMFIMSFFIHVLIQHRRDLMVALESDENVYYSPVSRKRNHQEWGREMLLLIGVASAPENFEKRKALRQSWFRDIRVRPGLVEPFFFIGQSRDPQTRTKVLNEAQEFRDIVMLDMKEGYYELANKTLGILHHSVYSAHAHYIMKCDDDSLLLIDRLLPLLWREWSNYLYLGHVSTNFKPVRDPLSPWYISREQFSGLFYPPFAHGPGYIVSRYLAALILEEHEEGRLPGFPLEDVGMGIWVNIISRTQQVRIRHSPLFVPEGCQSNSILGHRLQPEEMICTWRQYKAGKKDFCCQQQ